LASALVGGLCCSGALTRTATNVRGGAWGPVAGILSSSFLLGVMSIAAPLASHIPLATLAGLLTIVAWDMVDRKTIVSIVKRDLNESLVLWATFFLTVFRDVTEGIAVGVSFGSLLFMHRMAEFVEVQMNETLVGHHDEHDDVSDHLQYKKSKGDGVEVYHINGPLFFGVASTILAMLDSIEPEPRAFILDLRTVPIADGSAAEALLSFAQREHRDTPVYIIGANKGVLRTLIANGVDEHIVCFAPDEVSARQLISEEKTRTRR
jgi:SulP family sulfate permease